MPNHCPQIKQEYEELIVLKTRFALEYDKVKETGGFANRPRSEYLQLKKMKQELKQKTDALKEKLLFPYYFPRELRSAERKHNYKDIETLEGHTNSVRTLQVLPDGRLFSGSFDNTIKIWEKNPNGEYEVLQTLEGHTSSVLTLQVLPDGRLFSGSFDNTIKIWEKNPNGEYEVSQTLKGHTNSVLTLQVLPDGRLFSGSLDKIIKIWDGEKE